MGTFHHHWAFVVLPIYVFTASAVTQQVLSASIPGEDSAQTSEQPAETAFESPAPPDSDPAFAPKDDGHNPPLTDTALDTQLAAGSPENITTSNTPLSTAPQIDPILREIETRLEQLTKAELPQTVDVQQLFDVSLVDIDAVVRRIQKLGEEQARLGASRIEKENQLKNLAVAFPAPAKPKTLASPPIEPPKPVEPTAPVAPTVKKPLGKPSARRPEWWTNAYNDWQQFAIDMDAYEQSMAKFKLDTDAYHIALAQYQTELETYSAIKTEYEQALAGNRKQLAEATLSLKTDLADIRVRSHIFTLRLKYLRALHTWLEPLTAPARTALMGMTQKRVSLIQTIEQVNQLEKRLLSLNERLAGVASRAAAGSMVGFQAQLAQISADVQNLEDAFHNRIKKIQAEQRALGELRILLRKQSADIRQLIFSNVFHPQKAQLIDDMFMSQLTDMRKTANSHLFKDINLANTSRLTSEIAGIDKTGDQILSAKDATALVTRLKSLLEKIDVQLDEIELSREHQKQIFRRESVSILSNLATAETKKQAYSISQEMLADLSSDALSLKEALANWAQTRTEAFRNVPQMIKTQNGVVMLVRIFAAIILLIFTGLAGRRLGRFIASGIRRFSTSPLFRHRIGQLVRWAGIVEALLPTILVGSALYLSLSLIGFDLPEIQFCEVLVRWLLVYRLAGKLLDGLTRRISRGRPAFIPVSPEVSSMLIATYQKLGLVMSMAAIIMEWTTHWFGSGIIHTLIIHMLWLWLGVWGIWALVTWRVTVATAIQHRYQPENAPSFKNRLKGKALSTGKWMSVHKTGMLLTAPGVFLLLADWIYRQIRFLLYEGGIYSFFRARLIRRLANTQRRNSIAPQQPLPEEYLKEFPLYPIYDEEHAVVLPRRKIVDGIIEQVNKWKITKQDSSLVLVGEKGIGKTTLLTLLEQQLQGTVLRHSITQKLRSEKALVTELSAVLQMEECPPVVGSIAAFLNQGEQRIILLDEGHNVFLRTIDGYDAYEALIRLVNVTSQNVFWVLVFNSFSFAFLNASKNRLHYFRKLQYLPSWSRDELLELISKRNRQSGFEVEFDEVLLDASRSSSGDFEVIEGAEGFFRLLWETSAGNPRVATCLWLNALTAVSNKKIRVGIFAETLSTEIAKMDKELLYTLAAICQHENLSVAELRDVLNVSSDFANFAIRFLTEYGLLEPKHTDTRRHTLAPRFYPQILKLLRGHHLLYEKE